MYELPNTVWVLLKAKVHCFDMRGESPRGTKKEPEGKALKEDSYCIWDNRQYIKMSIFMIAMFDFKTSIGESG